MDHSEGSDTTLFVMQSISDLYAQAGISPFSCSIDSHEPNRNLRDADRSTAA